MPYPKGINTPEIRAAWLTKQREKIRAFDEYVGEGAPLYQAAQAVGRHASSMEAMRLAVEQLEEGARSNGRAKSRHIDLGLSLLACLRKPGETLTAHDIAVWCGCSRAAIQAIEVRALRKLRRRLMEAAADSELAQELKAILARGRGMA